jgi:hypothetical protein
MALIDDAITLVLLASAAFFAALSIGLLVRYRQVSQRISASSDLGHDLWSALEQRMKKQDERILDMMGRLEVIQSRVMAASASTHVGLGPSPPSVMTQPLPAVEPSAPAARPTAQQQESRVESQESQPVSRKFLDETQQTAIGLLSDSPKNTRQLTDALKKSREHTARLMKGLFQLGLVRRDDSTKPFVYQLTDEGRRHLRQP